MTLDHGSTCNTRNGYFSQKYTKKRYYTCSYVDDFANWYLSSTYVSKKYKFTCIYKKNHKNYYVGVEILMKSNSSPSPSPLQKNPLYLDSLMTFYDDLNQRYDKMWNRWPSWAPSWIYQNAHCVFFGILVSFRGSFSEHFLKFSVFYEFVQVRNPILLVYLYNTKLKQNTDCKV